MYIAGTVSASARDRHDLWDLYVDIPARTVTVNPKVQAMFAMGKYHKQVAEAFLRAYEAANPASGAYGDAAAAQALIKAAAGKTRELLDQLQSCKGEHADGAYVTLADLQAKKLPPNMESFLMNVAVAEGITKGGANAGAAPAATAALTVTAAADAAADAAVPEAEAVAAAE